MKLSVTESHGPYLPGKKKVRKCVISFIFPDLERATRIELEYEGGEVSVQILGEKVTISTGEEGDCRKELLQEVKEAIDYWMEKKIEPKPEDVMDALRVRQFLRELKEFRISSKLPFDEALRVLQVETVIIPIMTQ